MEIDTEGDLFAELLAKHREASAAAAAAAYPELRNGEGPLMRSQGPRLAAGGAIGYSGSILRGLAGIVVGQVGNHY